MKKLIATVLALVLVLALAACGETATNTPVNNTPATTEATTEAATEATNDLLNEEEQDMPTEETIAVVEPNAATAMLSPIWMGVPEDSRFFVMGGDWNTPVDGDAGNYSLEDAEAVAAELLIPAEQLANLTVASALRHAMNANNFTCGMYQLAEGADAQAFADAMKAAIDGTQWICGMPEKMIIAVVEAEYVLVCFGINDAITPFEAALGTVYADAEILYNAAIAG